MDSSEIVNLFKGESRFGGVFPRDCLPHKKTMKPTGLIANTDSSKEGREHWVAIILLKNQRGEYFDPFGFPPLHSDYLKFLNFHCENGWTYNSSTIQHPESKSCGHFCVAYLKSRFSGESFSNFISQFSVNLAKNEEIIK